ncbi:DUF948 domain-containing protein [Nodosilinea sp. LEGE 06152]|uniref:DUF948 domain-containing protein n=1 Tax=Nodosilinea sp. LEGE 06152 TaxID=2777966 RepID=UPI001882CED9|nr:DUF948 domain-containing protein [Nodosilinea sp. LEGE 06152]MBE9158023.1 DUF948 domain-containing protein [Nodosilinea sp. LEGE 06152]
MADPLFWLALSFLLVVISLTAVLMVAIPAMRELGRAARSAEKMFDTLSRELPPTLEAIRLTGLEITELTDDVTEGVQSAGQVVQQVNQSIVTAQSGAKRLNTGTRSLLSGARAAWKTWAGSDKNQPAKRPPERIRQAPVHSTQQLPASGIAAPGENDVTSPEKPRLQTPPEHQESDRRPRSAFDTISPSDGELPLDNADTLERAPEDPHPIAGFKQE